MARWNSNRDTGVSCNAIGNLVERKLVGAPMEVSHETSPMSKPQHSGAPRVIERSVQSVYRTGAAQPCMGIHSIDVNGWKRIVVLAESSTPVHHIRIYC